MFQFLELGALRLCEVDTILSELAYVGCIYRITEKAGERAAGDSLFVFNK